MKRVLRLVAAPAIALSMGVLGPMTAQAASIETNESAAAAVTAVSVIPSSGNTEVVIAIDGAVTVQDFTLGTPHRVVIDLTGARLNANSRGYDGVPRGGIRNIRMAQYSATVVRVVLDMDAPRDYAVTSGTNDIRVALAGSGDFAAWSSGGTPAAASEAPMVVERVEAQPESRAQAGARPQAVVTRPAAPVEAPRPRITVTYEDADIRDVLAAFASFSGRTIVTGKDVTGAITAEIRDQPWDIALRAILQAQGLDASEDASGIITVDSYGNILAKQASEPLVTQFVQVNYATAGSLAKTVETLLSKDCSGVAAAAAAGAGATGTCHVRGQVSADSGTNALLVTEVPSRMDDLVSYIRSLDVRTPQVSIKARLISVNRTQTEQLGLSYDLGSSNSFFNKLAPRLGPDGEPAGQTEYVVELGGNALTGVANANRKYGTNSALSMIFSTMIGKFSLTSFLDALSEENLSDVQAEPQITTLDNRTARVLVGQETPVRVIDAGSAGGAGVPARANVQFKETGIILEVTPHITSNRQILMSVYAEQSQLNVVGGDLGFFTDKRNARSQVLVADGETAVIGGLTQTQITRNRSGIPLLSQLPYIGRLFSQSDTREVKQDLLILLTPHIIDEGEGRGTGRE